MRRFDYSPSRRVELPGLRFGSPLGGPLQSLFEFWAKFDDSPSRWVEFSGLRFSGRSARAAIVKMVSIVCDFLGAC